MENQPKATETVRVFVYGLVQGVNYRRWLQGEALSRDVHGWVRNRRREALDRRPVGLQELAQLPEMGVFARRVVPVGENVDAPGAVDDLVRACRHGPINARVDRVHSEPAEYDGTQGFRIEDTV